MQKENKRVFFSTILPWCPGLAKGPKVSRQSLIRDAESPLCRQTTLIVVYLFIYFAEEFKMWHIC